MSKSKLPSRAANDDPAESKEQRDTDSMMAAHAERDYLDDLQMQFELDNPRPRLGASSRTPSPSLTPDPMRPAVDALEAFYRNTGKGPKDSSQP